MICLVAYLALLRYQILKDTQVSLDAGQKEQNANSVNILFGLSTRKHITSADSQITQAGKLRTSKQHRQAANILKGKRIADLLALVAKKDEALSDG